MDLTKWKSVLVPLDTYKALKKISEIEGRTIGGQLKFVFQKYCNDEGYEIRKLNKNKHEMNKKIIEIE